MSNPQPALQASYSFRQSGIHLPPISTQIPALTSSTELQSGPSTSPPGSRGPPSSLKRKRSAERDLRDTSSHQAAKREMLSYSPTYKFSPPSYMPLARGIEHLAPREPPILGHANPSVNLAFPEPKSERGSAFLQLPPIRERLSPPLQGAIHDSQRTIIPTIPGSNVGGLSNLESALSGAKHHPPNRMTLPPISTIEASPYEHSRSGYASHVSPHAKAEYSDNASINSPDSIRKEGPADMWRASQLVPNPIDKHRTPAYSATNPSSPEAARHHSNLPPQSPPLENGFTSSNPKVGVILGAPHYHLNRSTRYMWNVPPNMEESGRRKRRGNLPKESTAVLNEWFCKHLSNPYPSEEEKQGFQARTSLSMSQISNWFINARRRRRPKLMESGDNEKEAPQIQTKDGHAG